MEEKRNRKKIVIDFIGLLQAIRNDKLMMSVFLIASAILSS